MILDFLVFQLFVYSQLFIYFSQKSHLDASDHETAQSKDIDNENLDFSTWSAVCLLSAFFYFS